MSAYKNSITCKRCLLTSAQVHSILLQGQHCTNAQNSYLRASTFIKSQYNFSQACNFSKKSLLLRTKLRLSQWKIQSRHTLSNSARKRSVCSVDAPVCLGTHGSFSCRVGETISIGLIRNNEVRDLFQWRNRKAQTRARL